MSTALDDELIPEVFALLQEFGKDAVLASEVKAFTAAGVKSTTSSASGTFKITPPDPDTLKYVGGTGVQEASVGCFVASQGLTVPIKNDMTVTYDGLTHTVVAFSKIYTGELVALYALALKR